MRAADVEPDALIDKRGHTLIVTMNRPAAGPATLGDRGARSLRSGAWQSVGRICISRGPPRGRQTLDRTPRALATSSTATSVHAGPRGGVPGCDVDGYVVLPGLARDHVGDLERPALELAGGGVDQPVDLTLAVNRLAVEHEDENLAKFEMAPVLQDVDQPLVVQMPSPKLHPRA